MKRSVGSEPVVVAVAAFRRAASGFVVLSEPGIPGRTRHVSCSVLSPIVAEAHEGIRAWS
ncbi:MAG: hypothetical protein EOL86_04835 [Deltaproteobacteria bacterium]|nr:hypothetical protein [Deltaproteobacteria bacterium]